MTTVIVESSPEHRRRHVSQHPRTPRAHRLRDCPAPAPRRGRRHGPAAGRRRRRRPARLAPALLPRRQGPARRRGARAGPAPGLRHASSEHVARMRRPTPARLFAAIVDDWAADLESRDFERGCPVAAAVVDCADTNASRAAGGGLGPADVAAPDHRQPSSRWAGPRRAQALSTLMLCALEGAIVLARAQRDTAPLRLVPASSPPSSTPDAPHAPTPSAVRCIRRSRVTAGYIDRTSRQR